MARKRGTEKVADMVRSLAVVGVVIVPLWILIPHHQKQHVTTVDYSVALAQARSDTSRHVYAPQGLPSGWRPTSVSLSGGNGKPVAFHLGYLTPRNEYAAVEQSTGPAAAFVTSLEGKAPHTTGTAVVGSATWTVETGADGRTALVAPSGPTTVVVKGTAGLDELRTLAAALR